MMRMTDDYSASQETPRLPRIITILNLEITVSCGHCASISTEGQALHIKAMGRGQMHNGQFMNVRTLPENVQPVEHYVWRAVYIQITNDIRNYLKGLLNKATC